MSVSSTTRKQSFAGGQNSLAFTFETLPNYPTYIYVDNTQGGTSSTLTYTTHYTVTINTNGVGGTVVFVASYGTGVTHTVYRVTARTQGSDYDDFNQFPADTLEADLDRRTFIEQEIAEDFSRTVTLPIASTISSLTLPDPSAGKALIWNSAGTGLTNSTAALGDLDNYITSASTQAALAANYATTASTQATAAANSATTASTAATDASNYATTLSTLSGRGTFTNANVTLGTLLITYGSVASPFVTQIIIADSNSTVVIPDNVTYAATAATVNVTTFLPISGTWGYYYFR